MKQKKKREAKKAKKLEEGCGYSSDYEANEANDTKPKSNIVVTMTGDPEKDKKIKNIKRVIFNIFSENYSTIIK